MFLHTTISFYSSTKLENLNVIIKRYAYYENSER